jgi:hypothetical protein
MYLRKAYNTTHVLDVRVLPRVQHYSLVLVREEKSYLPAAPPIVSAPGFTWEARLIGNKTFRAGFMTGALPGSSSVIG